MRIAGSWGQWQFKHLGDSLHALVASRSVVRSFGRPVRRIVRASTRFCLSFGGVTSVHTPSAA